MKKLIVLLLIASIIAVAMPSTASQNTYTCETCHRHANLYTSHLEGGKYCTQCHGGIHIIHKNLDCKYCHGESPFTFLCHSAPSDVKIPTTPPGKKIVCMRCHTDIIAAHKGNCQLCHNENVNKIHEEANIFGR